MAKAGKFEITLYGPYPVWCELTREDEIIHQIDHRELSDLEYVVKKAMQEARAKLPEQYKDEV